MITGFCCWVCCIDLSLGWFCCFSCFEFCEFNSPDLDIFAVRVLFDESLRSIEFVATANLLGFFSCFIRFHSTELLRFVFVEFIVELNSVFGLYFVCFPLRFLLIG